MSEQKPSHGGSGQTRRVTIPDVQVKPPVGSGGGSGGGGGSNSGGGSGSSTMKVRKSSRTMTPAEWENFICAFKNMREGLFKGVAKPTLDDFADEHAAAFKEKNHDWYVHSHDYDERGHWGLMFFAWHRVFLNEFENRLRREVPGVTIPYWNAFKDPFPEELKKISDNQGERVDFTGISLPNFSEDDFERFQHDLEWNYHNHVHAFLGGTVGRRHSPRDATFWLHHAFVDRQWGHWFQKHNGATPPTWRACSKAMRSSRAQRLRMYCTLLSWATSMTTASTQTSREKAASPRRSFLRKA